MQYTIYWAGESAEEVVVYDNSRAWHERQAFPSPHMKLESLEIHNMGVQRI